MVQVVVIVVLVIVIVVLPIAIVASRYARVRSGTSIIWNLRDLSADVAGASLSPEHLLQPPKLKSSRHRF